MDRHEIEIGSVVERPGISLDDLLAKHGVDERTDIVTEAEADAINMGGACCKHTTAACWTQM